MNEKHGKTTLVQMINQMQIQTIQFFLYLLTTNKINKNKNLKTDKKEAKKNIFYQFVIRYTRTY